jgi:phosphoribosylaminoimidazole-succinocarboxamide synthase
MPKRWSTKNLDVIVPPSAEQMGVGEFEFTDDYSVFHYSKMPDPIPGKGETLCRMAVFTLRMLGKRGIPTHFLDHERPGRMRFRLVRILDRQRGELRAEDRCRLVPLQVICRNQLPAGASVYRRLAAGTLTLQQLGWSSAPAVGLPLEPPLIEFTTKLEEIDRFVTEDEARSIAALSDTQLSSLKRLTLEINRIVSEHATEVGLVHADSKIEFGIDDRGEVLLVDTAGTPDENRFLRAGTHVTKQVLRDFYLVRGLERDVQQWVAQGRSRSSWPSPEHLPAEYIAIMSDLYRTVSELWTGTINPGNDPLDVVVERLRDLQSGRAPAH